MLLKKRTNSLAFRYKKGKWKEKKLTQILCRTNQKENMLMTMKLRYEMGKNNLKAKNLLMFEAAAVKINKNALRTHTPIAKVLWEVSWGIWRKKDATENDQV